MSKTKFNKSVFFIDNKGAKRFLFKCINYGDNDNLKFIFNFPNKGKSIIFSPDDNSYPDNIEIRSYAELSYHQDGSLLWKFPKRKGGQPQNYYNPHGVGSRRTDLDNIKLWEPIVQGNIIRYKDCINEETIESEEIVDCKEIFDGTPFEYYVYLGNLAYANPPNNKNGEYIHRVNDVTEKLDMILWFRKSEFNGLHHMIGEIPVVNDNNRVKIIEPNFPLDHSGAFEIDLGFLNNAAWNAEIVNEHMKLNMNVLVNSQPNTLVCKTLLKYNPYLNQIKELLGYNKCVAISPIYQHQKLDIRLGGILKKENDSDTFIILTI
ncbi:hypothetical protein [Thermophagus xiamenensis]|uniref:Uncharacterized protein n=1 Tax=Thermophagus xiamenensis TaxID=385682 RepID=A0A1I1US14_9BACT|nr:hypothetical protein [Thermophagus xiamenensis]SFD70780.1 hypothetical protein SAMN05444380_10198 [Thermophagus xiamenensis]